MHRKTKLLKLFQFQKSFNLFQKIHSTRISESNHLHFLLVILNSEWRIKQDRQVTLMSYLQVFNSNKQHYNGKHAFGIEIKPTQIWSLQPLGPPLPQAH